VQTTVMNIHVWLCAKTLNRVLIVFWLNIFV
jgi:hypothetical protein